METKKVKITVTVNLNEIPANALCAALKAAPKSNDVEDVMNVKNKTDCLSITIDMKDGTIKDRTHAILAGARIAKEISSFAGNAAGYAKMPDYEKKYTAQRDN